LRKAHRRPDGPRHERRAGGVRLGHLPEHAEEGDMKIKERLVKVQLAVLENKVNGDGEYGRLVGDAAEAAMIKGMISEEWKNYMSLFADSADQFKRLTTTELDGNDEWLPRVRAYIVANGICAPAG
jgi:hypothetical protein